VGKPLKRLDTADKVNGKLVYGIDLKFPDMLAATIALERVPMQICTILCAAHQRVTKALAIVVSRR
jgi:hypothetical protein